MAGLKGANSTEFDPYTPHPVIDLMPEQLEVEGLGGTMRLGDWPMRIKEGTLLHRLYGKEEALERHRHRYEVNPLYVDRLERAGLVVSATTPGMRGRGAGLVEAIELLDHPFFLGLQSHPEFKSRPMRPSPPFAASWRRPWPIRKGLKAVLANCLATRPEKPRSRAKRRASASSSAARGRPRWWATAFR